jgi:hypothetical protein
VDRPDPTEAAIAGSLGKFGRMGTCLPRHKVAWFKHRAAPQGSCEHEKPFVTACDLEDGGLCAVRVWMDAFFSPEERPPIFDQGGQHRSPLDCADKEIAGLLEGRLIVLEGKVHDLPMDSFFAHCTALGPPPYMNSLCIGPTLAL